MNNKDDKALLNKVTDALDLANENMSPALQQELARRRQQALFGEKKSNSYWWMPAVAFSSVLFAVVMLNNQEQSEQLLVLEQANVMEISSEDPEMLSDLEFVYWLSQQDEQI